MRHSRIESGRCYSDIHFTTCSQVYVNTFVWNRGTRPLHRGPKFASQVVVVLHFNIVVVYIKIKKLGLGLWHLLMLATCFKLQVSFYTNCHDVNLSNHDDTRRLAKCFGSLHVFAIFATHESDVLHSNLSHWALKAKFHTCGSWKRYVMLYIINSQACSVSLIKSKML